MGRMKDVAIEREDALWDEMLSEVAHADATMPWLGERDLRGVDAGEPMLAARRDAAPSQQRQG